MKKFTSIIAVMLICFGVMAQTSQPTLVKKQGTLCQVSPNLKMPSLKAARQRGTTPFQIAMNPTYTDSSYIVGTLAGAYLRNYGNRMGENVPKDSLHSGDFLWLVAQFDTLVDANTGIGYSAANTPGTIDSLFYLYVYNRNSAASVKDTLIVSIYKGDITVDANNKITNVVLHADTVILDSAAQTGATTINGNLLKPNYTYANGTKFGIGFDFRSVDTANAFQMIFGEGDICNNACVATRSVLGRSSYFNLVNYGNPGPPVNLFEGSNYGVYYPQCTASGPTYNGYDSTACNSFFLQDLNVSVFMTIAPPLKAHLTASTTNACPGTSVTLDAGVTGGNTPYTYSWTGGTGIQTPFNSTTSVLIPATPLTATQTYKVVVTDSSGSKDSATITINVKGVGVNAGGNQNINCGSTATLTAVLSGSVGAGTVTTWTGPTGTVQGLSYPNAGPGKYVINVTNSSGCTAKDSAVVSLPTNQVVNFKANTKYKGVNDTVTLSPCQNAVVNFTNTSTNQTGWTWTWTYLHGGSNSSTTNLSTTYTTPGVDSVSLSGDSSGCVLTTIKSINVLPQSNVNCVLSGINDLNLATLINVFPNPSTGTFNVDFSGINSNNVNIMAYDILGKTVYTHNNFSVNGNETQSVDLSKNANGIYFIRVQVEGQPYTIKVSLNK